MVSLSVSASPFRRGFDNSSAIGGFIAGGKAQINRSVGRECRVGQYLQQTALIGEVDLWGAANRSDGAVSVQPDEAAALSR